MNSAITRKIPKGWQIYNEIKATTNITLKG
jgi:hypothetical protein